MTIEAGELQASARQVIDGLGLAADEETAWSLVAELGWLVLEIPEELGGLGLGLPAACALHEELGRGLARAPFLPATLAIDALCQSKEGAGVLGKLGSGEDYVAVPLADSALRLDGGALSGIARAVPSADRADHVLVWPAQGDRVLLVPTEHPGVELRARPTWDATRRLFDVYLAAVEPALVLASGTAAQSLVARLLVRRDFALAAEAVGGASRILELTVEYLGTRCQFGRPLAMFQALKHRCADLKAQVEAASALLQDSLARSSAAREFDYSPAAEAAGQAARLLAATAYLTVVEEALQLHGGIGMTAEHHCHLFLKRAMLDEHLGRGRDHYAQALAAGHLAQVD